MLKRLFDIIFSLTALIILSPVFLIVALIIKLDSPGPVFFKQIRAGKNFKPFKVLKFRTMLDGSEGSALAVTARCDSRITGAGKFLRRHKIDELPQFINVLKGDMSIVGPRPEVPEVVALYTDKQKEILSVKPGMTSMASVEYVDEEEAMPADIKAAEDKYIKDTLPKKLKYNILYLRRQSLWYDIVIICKTIKVLVFGKANS